MLHRLKQAVACVNIDGKPNGTAFLVDEEHVVTAHHVLLGRETVTLRFAEWPENPPDAALSSNENGIRTGKLSWQPANGADLAVLKLDRRCPPNVVPLALGALPKVDAGWSTFGYPRGVRGGHRLADGKVRDPSKLLDPYTYRFLQLETGAARESVAGYSGGPCVVDELVVGVLTTQLTRLTRDMEIRPSISSSTRGSRPETETARQPSLDTVYALPVDLLREWQPKIPLVSHASSAATLCIPFTRPNLLGCEPLLKKIHDLLSRRHGPEPLPVLVGPGGVGKTQLAVLYAHTYAAEYPGGIFWLDGSHDLDSIMAQLGSYMLRAGLAAPHPSGGPDYYAQLANLWLGRFGSRRDVLLIVDDVADSSFLVQQVSGAATWTFRSLAATVLATSRRRGIVGATDLDVTTLSKHDALELLRREANRASIAWDNHAATELVTALGALPLALRLAGGYLKRHAAVPMRDLAAVLSRAGVDASLEDVVALDDYPATLRRGIATVLAATLDEPADTAASQLLSVLACFPRGQPIQVRTLALLVDGRQNLGADASGTIDAPLDALRSVNILDATESDELRLHALIHAVRCAQLTHRLRRRVSRRLVSRLFEPRLLARQSGASLLSVLRDLAVLERMVNEEPLSAQVAALRRVLGRTAHLLGAVASPLPILHRQAVLMHDKVLARVLDRAASLRSEPWLRLRWSTRTTDRAEIRVLADASAESRACSLSADGELLVVGSAGGGVVLYRPMTGLRIMTRAAHAAAVLCVALSASGEVVASGATDRVVRIWDVRSGEMRLDFQAHEHTVLDVALDGAGALAVSCGMDRSVRSWSAEDGTCLSLWMHDQPVISCAISDDGRVALAGTVDGILRVFDPRTGEELERDRPETTPRLVQATLSPDGRFVLSGWANGALHLWDRIAGSKTLIQAPFARFKCAVTSCALSHDGTIAIAGLVDRTIRAWSTKDAKQVAVISGLVDSARSCVLGRDGNTVVAVAGDLRMWSLLAAGESDVAPVHDYSVHLSSISGDGSTGLTCGGDEHVKAWNLTHGAPMYELPLGEYGRHPLACALSRHGRTAITSARNLGNGTFLIITHKAPSGERRQIYRDPCFEEGLTRLWNTSTGELSRMLTNAHNDWVYAVAISAEGEFAATVSRDSPPIIWDLRVGNHRVVAKTKGAFAGRCCALADDASVLLMGGEHGDLVVWDVRTGESLRSLDGHQSCVISCSLSTNGKVAASASDDGGVRVWDMPTGRCTLELSRHGVQGCALSADASLLLVYGAGVVSILRTPTAELVVELAIEDVSTCSMSEDAGVLLVGDAAGHVSVFDRVTPPLVHGFLSKLQRSLLSLRKR